MGTLCVLSGLGGTAMVPRLPLPSGDFDKFVLHERAEVRYRRLGNASFSLPLVSVELTTANRIVFGLAARIDLSSLSMVLFELARFEVTVFVLALCFAMGSGID